MLVRKSSTNFWLPSQTTVLTTIQQKMNSKYSLAYRHSMAWVIVKFGLIGSMLIKSNHHIFQKSELLSFGYNQKLNNSDFWRIRWFDTINMAIAWSVVTWDGSKCNLNKNSTHEKTFWCVLYFCNPAEEYWKLFWKETRWRKSEHYFCSVSGQYL